MKIYGTGIYDNERADLVGLGYSVLAIQRVEEACEWLKTSQEPCQFLLAELDMLLTIARKFPKDMNVKLKKSQVTRWQAVFEAWYKANNKKIDKRYRQAIKDSADSIFAELDNYGHSLEWL